MHPIALLFNIPFLAVGIICAASTLIPMLFAALAFPGSSVIEAGPVFFGIYQLSLLAVIAGVCLRAVYGGLRYPPATLGFVLPYLGMFVWCVVITIVGPRIFQNAFYSVNAYSSFPTPVAPGTYNIVQLFAFVLQMVVLLLLYSQFSKLNAAKVDLWMKIGIVVTAALTLSQLATPGLYHFLSTNVFHNKTRGFFGVQEAADFSRLSGPFSEPSALASWFTAALGYLVGTWNPKLSHKLLALLCILILVISTSSTSFVGLAIVAAMFMAMQGRSVTSMLGVGIAMIALGVLGFFVFDYVYQGAANEILNRVLFEKTDSDSFAIRMGLNIMAFKVFFESWGLGVGAGTHRPSSEICMILSNVGVIGLFFYLVIVLKRLVFPWLKLLMERRAGKGEDLDTRVAMGLLTMAMIGTVIAMALGGDMSASSIHRTMLYAFAAYILAPHAFGASKRSSARLGQIDRERAHVDSGMTALAASQRS
ncbi:hypothetical protein SAMN07250955_11285 [Arboricoccus pini]|uniref:O-Antigen ligase n=1 Tax=Arboricoccus pini TaxID=1963835 RepID=A0A212RRD4_9PROT|nr:hypothetical protein [Arboricoccus pini]SNB75067.1 hypothetical protein SAMN07250955_11285 [Arboricoccus pini]